MAGLISAIVPESIAGELGLCPGDTLLAINGQEITDLIDYDYAALADELTLSLRRADGELWQIEVEKEEGEDLGLIFNAEVFDNIRPCRNHCLFCFIDQLQPAPRPTLLVKDDDYRMSFLEGNYITGTNLSQADIERIARLGLSPLYVSVHATDPALRGRLLGLPQPAPILPLLKRLINSGVALHTQIVLCPGINDGPALAQTLADLAALGEGIVSVAVVPVGLTRFQKNPELRLFTTEEAAALLDFLHAKQKLYQKKFGTRLVFAADELYLRAARPFPPASHYEGFEQLENGVGLAALFAKEWRPYARHLRERPLPQCANTAVVTGISGAAVLTPLLDDIPGLELLAAPNSFYGETITVTGLLTGFCLAQALPRGRYDRYIIPAHMLKHGSTVFLDDMTVAELADTLQTPVAVAENNARGLYSVLKTILF